MDLKFLSMFINADWVGGHTRAWVAAGLALAIAKYPGLSSYLDPGTQAAIGVAVSGIAVGVWSHVAKKIAAS